MTINGTSGNDNLNGTGGNDNFDLSQGGNDTVDGLGGDDRFVMGAAFTADDKIDGGSGYDTLRVNGHYTGGDAVVVAGDTMVNVESLSLVTGHSYDLTLNDANVAAGETLLLNGAALGASDTLTFDGSAELDGHFRLAGGAGNDSLTGGAQSDYFNLTMGGDDVAHGGAGDDTFHMDSAFTAADSIDGGTGNDMLQLNGDYTGAHAVVFAGSTMTGVETIGFAAGNSYDLTIDDGNLLKGETLLVNGASLGAGDSLTFDGSAELDGAFTLVGGAGDDLLTGGAQSDFFNLSLGGDDTANGGNGDDRFVFYGAFTAADKVDGGLGNDVLRLNGDYSGAHAVIFGADTMVNVETLSLTTGHSYDLTLDDGNVASGDTLLVNAAALGASDTLSFDGSAELDGNFRIAGGAGNDVLTAGAGNDVFNLAFGGNDIANGGAGDDIFQMGAAFTAADQIDGGSELDSVILKGDYSGAHAVTFADTTMVNVDYLNVSAGFNYDLTSADGTVAAFDVLTVDATALGPANSIHFDGSAETDGSFFFADGQGNDTFLGGTQSDVFSFDLGGSDTGQGGGGDDFLDACGHLDSTDQFDGGTGYDTMELTDEGGTYTGANALHLTAAMMANFEELDLDPGNYDITTVDANVAAGVTFTVDATFADQVSFDGSAESDGSFYFEDSTGNDGFKGGAQDDFLGFERGGSDTGQGGGGDDFVDACGKLDSTDQFDGGTGYDIMELTDEGGTYTGANALHLTAAMMANFEELDLDAGNYDITTVDANVASGLTFTVDARFADQLTFDGSAETDGSFYFYDSFGDDVLTGGANADFFNLSSGGDDIANGGGGDDRFVFLDAFTASDKVDGGLGADTLRLEGDYTGGNAVVFADDTMANVETLSLATGHSYDLTLADGNVLKGQTLLVNGFALGASDTLTFDGSAETDGNFRIAGGFGDDTLIGGAGNDFFNLAHGGTDSATGGLGQDTFNCGGTDTFVYGGFAESHSTTRDIFHGFDALNDTFDLAVAVSGVNATVNGSVSSASFDADLASIIGVNMQSNHAILVDAGDGDLIGHVFLVVDANGDGHYSSADYVFDVTGASNLASLSTGNFI